MSTTHGAGKPGQVSKGDREAVSVRPPVDLKKFYEQQAAELDIPVGTWCIIQINERNGLPLPDFVLDDLRRARERREARERASQRRAEEVPLLAAS